MPESWQPIFVKFATDTHGGPVNPNPAPLREVVRLPTNIKKVRAIKLCGFKQDLGVNADTVQLAALSIKEAETNNNDLLSNIEGLSSYFYIMPRTGLFSTSGLTSTLQSTAWESSEQGFRCSSFAPRNMPTLTFELRNAENNVGEVLLNNTVGDCYLWLRILTVSDD